MFSRPAVAVAGGCSQSGRQGRQRWWCAGRPGL